jgi:hypothetical protein
VHFDRLRVVFALPADGGWRSDLAIERSASPPRAVLVVRVPPSVAGDALSLSMLARGVDLASRVKHPALRHLLGTGEVEGDLALVEVWREGETLRGLIESGGPLTPELASRVAVDVAGALQACATLPAAMDRPLCHGAIRAERIMLTESGEVLLCGMGRPFAEDASPQDDLRNLARVLLESLPPASGETPGPLSAVLDRVLVGEGYPTATAFAEAVAAAVAPADRSAVAARVEASQSEGMPAWLAHRRALEQALLVEEEPAAPEATSAVEAPPSAPDVEAAAAVEAPPPRPPEPPAPATTPPPVLPPRTSTALTPALTPPRLPVAVAPSTAPTAPAIERVEPVSDADLPTIAFAAAVEDDDDQFLDLAYRTPPPGAAGPATYPLAALIEHPRAPVAVGLVLGLLGLLIGFALGGR